MIRVIMKNEPATFHGQVRQPGARFLARHPEPTKEQWKRKGAKIYRKAADDLFSQYGRLCAYSAEWLKSKNRSIDHYIPKSVNKGLAFEWSNFRLAWDIVNQNKGDSIVLDPFKIEDGWFVLDFDSNLIKASPDLNTDIRERVLDTISKLRLNGVVFQRRRTEWIDAYYRGSTKLEGLRKKAPFLVSEIERQNLQDEIKKKHERFLRLTTTIY